MNAWILSVLILATAHTSLPAPQTTARAKPVEQIVRVKGPDHSFNLTVPRGWVADQSDEIPDGFLAVFYPGGSSWKSSPVVLLATTDTHETQGFREYIRKEVAAFKSEPRHRVFDGGWLPTGDGRSAVVKHFIDYSGEEPSNISAYIDENPVMVMLILVTRKRSTLDSYSRLFKKFVASYKPSTR
jgi:hypothetical protein